MADLHPLRDLDDVVDVMKREAQERLYVRWTPDVQLDLRSGTSRDELTGVVLPGLSANSLALICDCRAVAGIDAGVIEEANRVIGGLPAEWGSLRRV